MRRALQEYRNRHLSPEKLLNFFRKNPKGAAFIAVPPGLGKTHLIKTSLRPLRRIFPRIHYAASQHRILEEILPYLKDLDHVYKHPKNPNLCGPHNTTQWEHLYRLNLTYLGKPLVCEKCPNQSACLWYDKESDKNKFLILQTQDHLFKNISSIPSGALTVLDELKFLDMAIQRRADRRELERYKKILHRFPQLKNLIYLTDVLLSGRKVDESRLKKHRTKEELKQVRKESFKFHRQLSVNEIYNFTPLISEQASMKPYFRDQAIYYNNHPKIPGALLVTGYGANKDLLEHYFQRSFVDLTPQEKYIDPDSRFYQLDSTSTSYFKFIKNPRSRAGILRFVAAKIESNRQAKKKTLLVAKRGAIALILQELPQYFTSKSHPGLQTFNPASSKLLDGIRVIPILHYGVEGINFFETYDCVICVTAYNLKASVIESQLKQLGIGRDVDVDIRNKPRGLGREVTTDPHTPLAKSIFNYLEHHKVLQTVSRARPFTTPTEVIFAGHQKFEGATVFNDVRELARALQVGSKVQRTSKIQCLLKKGLSQMATAKRLRLSVRTVSRYVKEIKKEGTVLEKN